MATIDKPASWGFAEISGAFEHAQGVSTCPYSLKTSVQDYGGKRRVLQVATPPLAGTDRSAWVAFVVALRGGANNFSVTLADYFPGEAGTANFRMASQPQLVWIPPSYIQYSFTAVEVL